MSPVSVGVDEKGRFVISTRETAMKTKGIRRNGRASLCVVSDKWYGEWIQLEGVAEVLSLPEAMEPLVEYYRAVAGEHDDWDEYRTAMEQQRRVLIRITADRVGPTLSG